MAVQYGDSYVEILTDLLRRFCDVKQMALALYLESFRYSKRTLTELGLEEQRNEWKGDRYNLSLAIVPEERIFRRAGIESRGLMIGAKKYILPGPMPAEEERSDSLPSIWKVNMSSSRSAACT